MAMQFSAPVSQILGLPPASTLLTAFRSAVNVSGYVSFAWTSYWFGCPKFRIKYADWIAEKKVHAMLEKLESEKHESAEAYLAVLDREVNALKEELSNRSADVSKTSLLKREADLLQLDLYKREVAALKEKVLSWESIRIEVELRQPGNLALVMNIARTIARKLDCLEEDRGLSIVPFQGAVDPPPPIYAAASATMGSSHGNGNAAKSGESSKGTNGATTGKLPDPVLPKGPPDPGQRRVPDNFRRLSRAEMAERRVRGLCFNCDEMYVTGHQCKRLFWIEVPDPDSEFED